MFTYDEKIRKILANGFATFIILGIGVLPLLFGTGCEGDDPSDETTSDTCEIAYVHLQPDEVYTSVGAGQIKFTAAAYDYQDRRIDPPPSFRFSCNGSGIRFVTSDQYAWLTPMVAFPSGIEVKAKCYDCEGEVYHAEAEIYISNPTN